MLCQKILFFAPSAEPKTLRLPNFVRIAVSAFPMACAKPCGSPARAYAVAPPVAYVAAPAAPYGGFWIRFLAHLIDHVILGAIAAPLFFIMVLPAIVRIAHEAEQNQEPPSPELLSRF